ncbi:MAG: tripartite tricarboxylate transporter TctB family protein [Deltaproteobacteria bacterium]|nr:tripartite tricarboxylate transporter TctB family protein [Deltaproteobacteria bacterium]
MDIKAALSRYSHALWSVLIFIFGLFFYWKSGEILRIQPKGQLGPDFWPRLVLGCLIAFSLLKGILALREARNLSTSPGVVADINAQATKHNRWRLAGGIVLVLAYAYLTELVGFPLANFVFLLSFMVLAGMRRTRWLLTLPTLATVIFLYLFVRAVYVPLPRGEGIFEDLTIALFRLLRIF